VNLNLKVKLSVSTSNCARLVIYGKKIFPLNLGTHEVQICVANNCCQPGTVNISCTFSESSRAKGYLSVLSSETNMSREMFVVANRCDMSSSDLEVNVSGVPPDNYTVVVYDIESNGLPVLSNETNPFVLSAAEKDVAVITEPQDTTCKK